MLVHVVNDDRTLGPDRFLNLGIALEIDAQVANGRILVHRDDTTFVVAGSRQHERAMRQSERLADATHQRLEDLVGADGSRDLLEDVEQQVA